MKPTTFINDFFWILRTILLLPFTIIIRFIRGYRMGKINEERVKRGEEPLLYD